MFGVEDGDFSGFSEYSRGYEEARKKFERPTRHWTIEDTEGNRIWKCRCSECKNSPLNCVGGIGDWWLFELPNFCPNCGADMRGCRE